MTYLQQQLLDAAKQRYGNIQPCDGTTLWDGCFTELDGNQLFWFNTNDGSTHAIKENAIIVKKRSAHKGSPCF